MRRFDDQVVMVTGASSGIGEALARELSRRGARVVLCARRTDRLEPLAAELSAAGAPSLAVTCDITRDGDCERAVAATIERFGRLDVVVANAGFGVVGKIERLGLDDYRRQFETNVFGVLRTLYAALPALKESRGCFAPVGSVSGYLSFAGTAPYAMSKFAVRAFADALGDELRGTGVSVVQITPGFIESEIRSKDNAGDLREGAKDPIPSWLVMPRDKAARQMADALGSRQRELILTGHGKLGVFLAQKTPWIVRAATRLGAAWETRALPAGKSAK